MFTYRDYIYLTERHQDHIAHAEQQRLVRQPEQTGLRSVVEQSDRRNGFAGAINVGPTNLGQRMMSAMNGLPGLGAHGK